MPTNFTVSLSKVMKELGLSVLFMPEDPEKIMICSMDVNRPGSKLNRFYDYFDTTRILIFGNAETAFLNSLSTEGAGKFSTRFSNIRRPRSLRVISNRL